MNAEHTYVVTRRFITDKERRRVSRALDIIRASQPSRKHELYLGEPGSKDIVVQWNQTSKSYDITITRGSRSHSHLYLPYGPPPSWKQGRITRRQNLIYVRGLSKNHILDSLQWFGDKDFDGDMFEIYMGNAAPTGIPHPLEHRPENRNTRKSLLDGAHNKQQVNRYIREQHGRKRLHSDLLKEVARRRANRAAREEALAVNKQALAAHRPKLAAVLENLKHLPPARPVASFPGGSSYHRGLAILFPEGEQTARKRTARKRTASQATAGPSKQRRHILPPARAFGN